MNKTAIKFKQIIQEVTISGLTDKASYHAYDEVYPDLFLKVLALGPGNILEVGTGKGGGLQILRRCFPDFQIFGLDHNYSILDPAISNFNIEFLPEMKQSNRNLKKHLPGNIKLVIEDASHVYKESIKTFEIIRPFLAPGGLYVIEDVYPQYRAKYESDSRFEVIDLRSMKNRDDDVLAVYTNI